MMKKVNLCVLLAMLIFSTCVRPPENKTVEDIDTTKNALPPVAPESIVADTTQKATPTPVAPSTN